ncbi:sacsin-like [Hydractinia symbiolongicarpus]|uniref:sacsin-like n=1 Tax=Hydractinia symbiolongicarpus TaxID=13093 RepID=UPI00254F3A51|nr:sacsin-like [Hydractinia symbiolongicarpus]
MFNSFLPSLQDYITDQDVQEFQRLKRIDEIQNILKENPDKNIILKEFVRNAENAGASRIVFIHDENDHRFIKGQHFSSDIIAESQGPALYVFMDTLMTPSDWDELSSIHRKLLRDDFNKRRRFGDKFQSVFHISDQMVVASGSRMAYVDPLTRVQSDLEYLDFSQSRDRMLFADVSLSDFNLFKKLPPRFSLDADGFCNGTLFRFPLRHVRTELSKACCTKDHLTVLFESFIDNGHLNLLFAKNLETISLYKIGTKKNTLKEVFMLKITEGSSQQYQQKRKDFHNLMKGCTGEQNLGEEVLNHHVKIEERIHGLRSVCSYDVSEQFGCHGDLNNVAISNNLFYNPYIAVAMPMDDVEAGVVCSSAELLNPAPSGFPVYINGGFVDSLDILTWKDSDWNDLLVKHLLPIVYVNLMKFMMQEDRKFDLIYQLWPDLNYVNQKWLPYCGNILAKLTAIPSMFVENKKEWVFIKDAVFINERSFRSRNQHLAVFNFLESLAINVVNVPDRIVNTFKTHFNVVNKESIQLLLKHYPQYYHQLTTPEQSHVFSFVFQTLSDLKNISGLMLLRLGNGQYSCIQPRSEQNAMYLTTNVATKEILPRWKNVVDEEMFYNREMLLTLVIAAARSGQTNLVLLDNFENVRHAVISNLPQQWTSTNQILVEWPLNDHTFPEKSWLSYFWRYVKTQRIRMEKLDGLPLIPITQLRKQYLYKLCQPPLLMCDGLSNGLEDFFRQIGLIFCDGKEIPSLIDDLVSADRLLLPTNGVLQAFQNIGVYKGVDMINVMLDKSSPDVHQSILEIILQSTEEIPAVICDLNLLTAVNGNTRISIRDGKIVNTDDVPKVWNCDFGKFVISESISDIVNGRLHDSLTYWSFEDISAFVLQNYELLSEDEVVSFNEFLLQRLPQCEVSEIFLDTLKNNIFVTSEGVRCQPKDLFERTELFDLLFSGEVGRFPDENFDAATLKLIGLKSTINDITVEDIGSSIQSIINLSTPRERITAKAKAILSISFKRKFDLGGYMEFSWMPIQEHRPTDYPSSLEWFGGLEKRESVVHLEAVGNIYAPRFNHLVGSVSYIVDEELTEELQKLHFIAVPTLDTVLSHLEKIHDIEDFAEEETLLYCKMIFDVYKYLALFDVNDVASRFKENNFKIWQGKSFLSYDQISLAETKVDVSPYFELLPKTFPKSFKQVLQKLGCCGETEETVYVEVLGKMKVKYDEVGHETSDADLKLALKITTALAGKALDDEVKSSIFIPVESETLKFCLVKDCFYFDFKEDTSTEHIKDFNIVHRKLGRKIADQLGVPYLVCEKMISDVSSSKNQEILISRIKNNIDEQSSETALPVQLIRNGDSIGATKVCFLFDERQNKNFKTALIDGGMKDWQGPALWVYFNTCFKDEDFQILSDNCTGKSKTRDFHAVYSITDVPSYFSGDTMLIVDPHMKYLGKACEQKNIHAVKIPITPSNVNAKKFSDQFKPFHGIFGACVDYSNENVKQFDGTLIRLPLRNDTTAAKSKLKQDLVDMKLLFEGVKRLLSDLLLFTKHVCSVEILYLNAESKSFAENLTLCSVHRNIILPQNKMDNQDISGNEEIEERMSCVEIQGEDDKTKKWYVARDDQSSESNSAVAIGYEEKEDGTVTLVTDAEINNIYSFLPLQVKSFLPVSIHDARLSVAAIASGKVEKEISRKIVELYLKLIVQLCKQFPGWSLKEWIQMFPLQNHVQLPFVFDIAQQVTKHLCTCSEAVIPIGGNVWMKWDNVRFLTKTFDQKLTRLVLSYMNWYYKQSNQKELVCVELSDEFTRLFPDEVSKHTVNEENFLGVFFKSLHWDGVDQKVRDEILSFLLNEYIVHKKLRKYLSSTPCIPTQPRGRLRLPSELVMPDSRVGVLYHTNEEVFPETSFQTSTLQALGMVAVTLSWERLIKRIKSVWLLAQNKDDIPCAILRSQYLVQFIEEKLQRDNLSDEARNELLHEPFIPVLKKTDDSLFSSWYMDERMFASIGEVYPSKYKDIACLSVLLCGEAFDKIVMKLKPGCAPAIDTVKLQMVKLNEIHEAGCKDDPRFIHTLQTFYDYLKHDVKNVPYEELKNLKVLYTNTGELALPHRMYFEVSQEIPNYIHQLPALLRLKFPDVMLNLGVRKHCDVNTYVQVLQEVKEDFTSRLPESILHTVLYRVLPQMITADCSGDIFLPDRSGVMRNVRDMYFTEQVLLHGQQSDQFIHEGISKSLSCRLGIRQYQRPQNAIQLASDGGNLVSSPSLFRADFVPNTPIQDVLKEMLFNADDAACTEVEFVLDSRHRVAQTDLCNQWKEMLGPALILKTNSVFTKDNLQSFPSLNRINCDVLTTGMYGRGDVVACAITDYPSVLTHVAACNSVLKIVDCNALSDDNAIESGYFFLENAYNCEEVKETFLVESLNPTDSKDVTLFRFPLRTENMAYQSQVSNNVTTIDDMKEIIGAFLKDVPGFLLLLRHVEKLSFSVIDENGKVASNDFRLRKYGASKQKVKNFQNFEKKLHRNLGNVTHLTRESQRILYNACLQHTSSTDTHVHHVNMLKQVGFSDLTDLDSSIVSLVENNELKLIPMGVVVSILEDNACPYCESVSTCNPDELFHAADNFYKGLLNNELKDCIFGGNFVLNAQEQSYGSSGELKQEWNRHVLKNCVVPCYVEHVVTSAERLAVEDVGTSEEMLQKVNSFYQLFPSLEDFNPYDFWDSFVEEFYRQILSKRVLSVLKVEENCLAFYTPKEYLVYIPATREHSFMCVKSQLLCVLQRCMITTDVLPERITSNIEKYGTSLTKVTPALVREQLNKVKNSILPAQGENRKVSASIFQNIEDTLTLLRYCLSEDNNVEELPLCIAADGSISEFSSKKPLFFTRFSNIFVDHKGLFVHPLLFQTLLEVKRDWSEQASFKDLTFEAFLELFEEYVPTGSYLNSSSFASGVELPTEEWLNRVWMYLLETNDDRDQMFHSISSLPLLLTTYKDKKMLLPVGRGKAIMFCDDCNDDSQDLMKAYGDGLLEASHIFDYEIAKHIFGCVNVAENYIDAMLLSFECGNNKPPTPYQARLILEHLNQQVKELGENYVLKLCSLPLFERLDGQMGDAVGEVFFLERDVPPIAKEFLKDDRKDLLLKTTDTLKNLFLSLHFNSLDSLSVYKKYIFPVIDRLTDEKVMEHMQFLKNEVLPNKTNELLNALAAVKFVPTQCGERKCVTELHDPNIELFTLLLSKDDFPSDIYVEGDWLIFLKSIGLKTKVTVDLFVKFAKHVEGMKDLQEATKLSKKLCEELSESDLFLTAKEALSKIKSINFIIPYKINERFEKISASKNLNQKKICFNNSSIQEYEKLLWTTTTILPKYAVSTIHQATQLGVMCPAQDKQPGSNIFIDRVIQHIKNITESITSTDTATHKKLKEEDGEVIVDILSSFYKFVADTGSVTQDIARMCGEISCILVCHSNAIDIPSRAFLCNDTQLSPYLNPVFPGFENQSGALAKIGCAKHPTAKSYCDMLASVHLKIGGNALDNSDFRLVKIALFQLSESLKEVKESELKGVELFLPTSAIRQDEMRMTISKQAIFINDLEMLIRLKYCKEQVLLLSYEDDKNKNDRLSFNQSLYERLPLELKPKLITEVVIEFVATCQQVTVNQDHVSMKVKSVLQSPLFLKSLARLVMDRETNSGMRKNTFQMFKNAKIIVVKDLVTSLTYRGEVILDSKTKKIFFVQKTETGLVVYVAESAVESNFDKIPPLIFQLFCEIFKQKENVFLQLFHPPPDGLEKLLEQNDIRTVIDMAEVVNFDQIAWMEQDIVEFNKNEAVIVRAKKDQTKYCYGKIVAVEKHTNKALAECQVKIFENITETIKAMHLYRYDVVGGLNAETKTTKNKSAKDQEAEISSMLTCSQDEEEVKIISRRLYMKHFTNDSKESPLFNHVQKEIKKLNKEIEKEFSAWNHEAKILKLRR